MEAICFDLVAFFWRVMRVFFCQVFDSFSICLMFFFCVQDYLFDYFGSMGFSRARGPLSYVEAVFFYDF